MLRHFVLLSFAPRPFPVKQNWADPVTLTRQDRTEAELAAPIRSRLFLAIVLCSGRYARRTLEERSALWLKIGRGVVALALFDRIIRMTGLKNIELIAVEGRQLRFMVSRRDQAGVVSEGFHDRAIIDIERFMARAAARGSDHV